MLAQKKLTQKKLIIYSGIIVLMLGGTAFMLYQNSRLTAPAPANPANQAMFNGLTPTSEIAKPAGPPAETPAPAAPNTATADKINAVKSAGGLDLTIFSKDKFMQLKSGRQINKIQAEAGKRDPFKPN